MTAKDQGADGMRLMDRGRLERGLCPVRLPELHQGPLKQRGTALYCDSCDMGYGMDGDIVILFDPECDEDSAGLLIRIEPLPSADHPSEDA